MQQKYALVTTALIHGTTNKRGGQVTPSKIEFCTCAFYQQKIRIQHKIFYTISPNTSTTWYRYKNTKRIWYTMNQTMNTQFYKCRKMYSNNFYYHFLVVTKAHSSFGGSELLSFYASLLSFQASLLCFVFQIFWYNLKNHPPT